jgi:hypothetical protein
MLRALLLLTSAPKTATCQYNRDEKQRFVKNYSHGVFYNHSTGY